MQNIDKNLFEALLMEGLMMTVGNQVSQQAGMFDGSAPVGDPDAGPVWLIGNRTARLEQMTVKRFVDCLVLARGRQQGGVGLAFDVLKFLVVKTYTAELGQAFFGVGLKGKNIERDNCRANSLKVFFDSFNQGLRRGEAMFV